MSKPERRDTGRLAQDSPAVMGAIRRIFSAEDVLLFESLYQAAALAGGLDEGPVLRIPNASFNPRPARICKILMREVKEQDMQVLGAALLLSLPEQIPVEPGFEQAFQFAHKLRSFIEKPGYDTPHAIIERLHLAMLLDNLRHLHMTSLSPSEKEAVVESFEELYQSGCKFSENTPLLEAASAAARRVRVHLFSGDLP